MGDQDGGRARLAEQLLDVRADAGPQVRVERGKRLVEQHDLRPDGQRPGQRHPLLLAAGKLMRVAPGQAGQPDRVEKLGGARPATIPAGQPEPDVRLDGEVREEAAFLGDVADAPPFRGQVDAGPVRHRGADRDRPGVGPLEAGQHAQQCGLAAAGRAEDGGQGSGRYLQVQPGEHPVGPEGLVQAGRRELGHGVIPGSADGRKTARARSSARRPRRSSPGRTALPGCRTGSFRSSRTAWRGSERRLASG